MKLKADANIADFMSDIQRCRGEVFFDTAEGDHLNLKSTLSQFVFIAVSGKLSEVGGQIQCDARDLPLLAPYFEQEEMQR